MPSGAIPHRGIVGAGACFVNSGMARPARTRVRLFRLLPKRVSVTHSRVRRRTGCFYKCGSAGFRARRDYLQQAHGRMERLHFGGDRMTKVLTLTTALAMAVASVADAQPSDTTHISHDP